MGASPRPMPSASLDAGAGSGETPAPMIGPRRARAANTGPAGNSRGSAPGSAKTQVRRQPAVPADAGDELEPDQV